MNVGQVTIPNRATTVREIYVTTYVNVNVGAGTNFWYIGSFTAPFTCYATLNGLASLVGNADGTAPFVRAQMGNQVTNMVPTNFPLSVWESQNAVSTWAPRFDIPFMAYYASIPAGFTVNMYLYMESNYVVYWDWAAMTIRCVRT